MIRFTWFRRFRRRDYEGELMDARELQRRAVAEIRAQRTALADAAREKREAQERELDLQAQVDHLAYERDRALAQVETLTRSVEHLGKLLQETLADTRTERVRVDELIDKLDTSHRQALDHVRALSDGFATQLAELRRDGFNPMGPVRPPLDHTWIPVAAAEPDPKVALLLEEQRKDGGNWNRVMEAIQDRAGGDPQLHSRLLEDASRWRDAAVPFVEIENRIYHGEE